MVASTETLVCVPPLRKVSKKPLKRVVLKSLCVATLILKLPIRTFTSQFRIITSLLQLSFGYCSIMLISNPAVSNNIIICSPCLESNAEKKTVLVGDGTFIGKHVIFIFFFQVSTFCHADIFLKFSFSNGHDLILSHSFVDFSFH